MENNKCICYRCENEINRGDRFIIISMEQEEYICIKCFIRDELTVLKVPEETINKLSNPGDNIEEIKKSLIL